MEKETQDRSVTIRIKKETYQKLTKIAIDKSIENGKIVKISEIIRMALGNFINNG